MWSVHAKEIVGLEKINNQNIGVPQISSLLSSGDQDLDFSLFDVFQKMGFVGLTTLQITSLMDGQEGLLLVTSPGGGNQQITFTTNIVGVTIRTQNTQPFSSNSEINKRDMYSFFRIGNDLFVSVASGFQ
jgi:hypothetical protein